MQGGLVKSEVEGWPDGPQSDCYASSVSLPVANHRFRAHRFDRYIQRQIMRAATMQVGFRAHPGIHWFILTIEVQIFLTNGETRRTVIGKRLPNDSRFASLSTCTQIHVSSRIVQPVRSQWHASLHTSIFFTVTVLLYYDSLPVVTQ